MRRFQWGIGAFILVLISSEMGLAKLAQRRKNFAKKTQVAVVKSDQFVEQSNGSLTLAYPTSRFQTREELFEHNLKKPQLNVQFQMASFSYVEPNIMSDKGLLYGVHGEYAHPLKAAPILFFGQFDYMDGTITYDGAVVDIEDSRKAPIPVSNATKDTLFEFRAMSGYKIPMINSFRTITPYGGFGARYLTDLNNNIGGYKRQITYYYLPLGIRAMQVLNHKWNMDGYFEYDHFLSGETKSYLSSNPIVHHQKEGRGYRLGVGGNYHRLEQIALRIEVFYQSWTLGNSDIVTFTTPRGSKIPFVEPANQTDYFGISIGIAI